LVKICFFRIAIQFLKVKNPITRVSKLELKNKAKCGEQRHSLSVLFSAQDNQLVDQLINQLISRRTFCNKSDGRSTGLPFDCPELGI
jgi:hypothetical protein